MLVFHNILYTPRTLQEKLLLQRGLPVVHHGLGAARGGGAVQQVDQYPQSWPKIRRTSSNSLSCIQQPNATSLSSSCSSFAFSRALPFAAATHEVGRTTPTQTFVSPRPRRRPPPDAVIVSSVIDGIPVQHRQTNVCSLLLSKLSSKPILIRFVYVQFSFIFSRDHF